MYRLTNVVIGIAVALISISLWAYINQPTESPAWPDRVTGFSFSPMRADFDPDAENYPGQAEIEKDLALLSGKTVAIRTYTVENILADVPALADTHDLNVCLGAWLGENEQDNAVEFQRFLRVARDNPNVVRAIVGNETQLHGMVPYDELVHYLDQARKKLRVPVSTAEPAHIWLEKQPELVKHVDFIAVQILPYWEGIDVGTAVDHAFGIVKKLRETYPDKPVIISEIGWPSKGRARLERDPPPDRPRQQAVASEANQAMFLRNFLARVKQEKVIYYILEAFDQPWKSQYEGAVGAYWGVYDAERFPKFEFTQPIVLVPDWKLLASISIILAAITFGLLLIDSRTMRGHGRSFLAIVSFFAATVIVWIVYEYTSLYLTLGTVLIGILLVMGMIGILAVLLAEAHEWAEAIWSRLHRHEQTASNNSAEYYPRVSIHVPAYNEPPEMLRQTLQALARLNYPDFEVLVIDNNTKDPAIWQPVQKECERLGERFRFFHVDPLDGFKAGALNFALQHTAADAEVVAVIDSDYVVDPDWLHDLVPHFVDDRVAIVQAPQDYRDEYENAFKAMCYSEYRGFFFIGMVTRNERNAIIQHGTMTMIRKNVLEQVGGWGEWCITEDAELGLRIFEQGYEAVYTPHSYGRGLMPDSFNAYKKQRDRWAYGAVQIFKHHWRSLLGRKKSSLSMGQRYHFIAGWLPWFADGVNFLFTAAAIFWSSAMILFPMQVDPPLVMFAILPLTLFCFKIAKIIYLYRTAVNASMKHTISAAFAGLALSHTIAMAIMRGLFTRNNPFVRTPKMKSPSLIGQALVDARWEFLLALGLWAAAWGVYLAQPLGGFDVKMWITLLLIQSLPYVAAVIMAFISAMPSRRHVERVSVT